MVTETLSKEVGSIPFTKSLACHPRVLWERFIPKMETHVADAKPGSKLAALVTELMLTTGDAACTVSVTARDAGLPLAPGATIWTLEVYVPAARVAGLTDTESVAGAVPDAGESATHDAPDEAAQESVPPPAFVIETFCATGAAPPTV